jgi:hypothetical protein
MRFLCKFKMDVRAGNQMAKNGTLGSKIAAIVQEQKPEAIYFGLEDGRRTAFMIINLDDASQIPAIAEPWFLACEASIEAQPVMTPEDLQKAGPAIGAAAKKFA